MASTTDDGRVRLPPTTVDNSAVESDNTNSLTARTSASEARYFARTSSNEKGAATNFAVIRKAFFILRKGIDLANRLEG